MAQVFKDSNEQHFSDLEAFPGASWLRFAEPVPNGSIHRLRMIQGAVIPTHAHPSDEYVFVISGRIETGGRICETGCFWITPKGVQQGPHKAVTDVQLLTVRLGRMGTFDDAD
jgi:anti-sigma factor ChrR (cupin superfamily)